MAQQMGRTSTTGIVPTNIASWKINESATQWDAKAKDLDDRNRRQDIQVWNFLLVFYFRQFWELDMLDN